MSRYRDRPKGRAFSSLTARDIDRLREFDDARAEFLENSGEDEARFERAQARWLTKVDEDELC